MVSGDVKTGQRVFWGTIHVACVSEDDTKSMISPVCVSLSVQVSGAVGMHVRGITPGNHDRLRQLSKLVIRCEWDRKVIHSFEKRQAIILRRLWPQILSSCVQPRYVGVWSPKRPRADIDTETQFSCGSQSDANPDTKPSILERFRDA